MGHIFEHIKNGLHMKLEGLKGGMGRCFVALQNLKRFS